MEIQINFTAWIGMDGAEPLAYVRNKEEGRSMPSLISLALRQGYYNSNSINSSTQSHRFGWFIVYEFNLNYISRKT